MKGKIKSTVAEQPSFFLYDPWSSYWTPEKHRYLAMSNGLLQNTGLKNASHRGLTTRADHEKGHPPGFSFRGVQRCANQAKGF
jgi:hypothetical protein